MPYNAGTNRRAKDFAKYACLRLNQDVANFNALVFDNTITTGTTCIDTCAVSAKNTLIQGYETDFANGIAAWNFSKSASNYLLAGDNGTGGFEFYPPKPLYEGLTDFKVLGKCNNEVWGSTSADGITWASVQKFIPHGNPGDWDAINTAAQFITKENGLYKVLVSGYNTSPNYNYKMGYAYNSSFTNTGWTKHQGYILDVSGYNAKYGTSWDSIQVQDAVKIGVNWYYFGVVYNNAFTNGELVYGIGANNDPVENMVLDTRICTFSDISYYWNWIQGLNVFKHPTTGVWYMITMMGVRVNDASTNNQAIYHFNSGRTDLPIFSASNFNAYQIMAPDTTKIYENNYNYTPNMLKDSGGNLIQPDGNNWMYYAGHQNTATPTYTGVMCLATIASIP